MYQDSAARSGQHFASLPLHGPARVEVEGEVVRLQRKGLALIYYLSLEGPARREHVADLLWNNGNELHNLRVELHRIKGAFKSFGLQPFADGRDPIRLRDTVRLYRDGMGGVVMNGLDDVSGPFQEWLDLKRISTAEGRAGFRSALVDELWPGLTPPFVLILSGEPGSGGQEVARGLAQRLDLPFVTSPLKNESAVRYLDLQDANVGLAQQIANDKSSVWVLRRSHFGEDPELLLSLRARLPASQLRFIKLEPLEWWDVRDSLLEGRPFPEASQLYLESSGNPWVLQELLKLRNGLAQGTELPTPLRARATIELESRRLSPGARHAINRLSVHRGPLSLELLRDLGAETFLDELELEGWLHYDDSGWHFTSELARRMLRDLLPAGTRRRVLSQIATHLGVNGRVGGISHPDDFAPTRSRSASADSVQAVPETVQVEPGDEIWLDEPILKHESARLLDDLVVFAHGANESGGATWRFEEWPVLVRLAGRALVERSPADEPLESLDTLVLTLQDGRDEHKVRVGQVGKPGLSPEGVLRLPASPEFSFWFLVRRATMLHLQSPARGAVLEVTISAFRPRRFVTGAAGSPVNAFALDGLEGIPHQQAFRRAPTESQPVGSD